MRVTAYRKTITATLLAWLVIFASAQHLFATAFALGGDLDYVQIDPGSDRIVQTGNIKDNLIKDKRAGENAPYIRTKDFGAKEIVSVSQDFAGDRLFLELRSKQADESDSDQLLLRRSDLRFIGVVDPRGGDLPTNSFRSGYLRGIGKHSVFVPAHDPSHSQAGGKDSCRFDGRYFNGNAIIDTNSHRRVKMAKQLAELPSSAFRVDCAAGNLLLVSAPLPAATSVDLTLYDLSRERVRWQRAVGEIGEDIPNEWMLSPDGMSVIWLERKTWQKGYVPSFSGRIVIFDAQTGEKKGETRLPVLPMTELEHYGGYDFLWFSADSSKLFLSANTTLFVIDLNRHNVTGRIDLPFKPVAIVW